MKEIEAVFAYFKYILVDLKCDQHCLPLSTMNPALFLSLHVCNRMESLSLVRVKALF